MGYYNNQPKQKTYYFHDYETFGVDPKSCQASQFAGIRTDENLNIIPDSEMNIYCKMSADNLPSPMACLVTNLTPQRIKQQDPSVVFTEYEFIKKINDEMSKPNTSSVGYNNVNFDDEWTRNLLYRNYFDAFEREWKNGCSRLDGINFVMFAYLINPEILNFPQSKDENGELLFDNQGNPLPSFKLEELSAANGIVHENAHDALSDVKALIGVLKIIKDKDPELFSKVEYLNNKRNASQLLNDLKDKPMLHVSSFYGKVNNSCGVVQYLGQDPSNPNKHYVFDLLKDPNVLLKSSEDIKEQLFSSNDELEEMDLERAGIKNIVLNKLPLFAGLGEISHRADDLGFKDNRDLIVNNKNKLNDILNQININEKLGEIFKTEFPQETDPDYRIYDGFPTNNDKSKQTLLRNYIESDEMVFDDTVTFTFESPKYNELFYRFKGRSFPEAMTRDEKVRWNKYVIDKLNSPESRAEQTFETFFKELEELKGIYKDQPEKIEILKDLQEHGENHPANKSKKKPKKRVSP